MIRQLLAISGPTLLLAAGVLASAGAQEPPAQPRGGQSAIDQPAADDRSAEPAVRTSPSSQSAEESAAEETSEGPGAGAPAPARAPRATRFKTVDRLELDPSAITGNQELPKVLYIVPWKKSELGDLIGKPANSLLDEVLTPVDRDVFRRQTDYFSRLESGAAAPQPASEQDSQQPPGQPAPQGEQGQGQPPGQR